MTKPLSIDLRLRVVEAIDAGMSRRAAADRFGVAASAAIKWHELWRRTGAVEARPQGGDARSIVSKRWRKPSLRSCPRPQTSRSQRSPSASSATTASALCPQSSIASLPGTGSASKKTAHAAEQDRPDVAHRRRLWSELQPTFDPESLVFIDETGASTKACPRESGDGAALWPRPAWRALPRANPTRTLEDHDVHWSAATRRLDRAHGARWADECRCLPGLHRTGARPYTQIR